MLYFKSVWFLALALFCLAVTAVAQEESITITTYFPSPFGSYMELNTHYLDLENNTYQEQVPTDMPDAVEGRMIYDRVDKVVKYYNGNRWIPVGGGGAFGSPDFDSGWINLPGVGTSHTLSFSTDNRFGTRDITGKNPEKFLVFVQCDGTGSTYYPTAGLTNYGYGGEWGTWGGTGGVWYSNLTSSSIKVNEHSGWDYIGRARVYIWSWE